MESFKADGVNYLATLCSEKYLKIVKFEEEKAACILSFFTFDNIKWMRGFEDRLALVMKKGFFEIFSFNGSSKFTCIQNNNSEDHEEEILSLDQDSMKKLIATSAADNKIKIWTYYRVLVYEVILDDGLRSAVWFRNFEMLVSHNLKILYFRNIGLFIDSEEI